MKKKPIKALKDEMNQLNKSFYDISKDPQALKEYVKIHNKAILAVKRNEANLNRFNEEISNITLGFGIIEPQNARTTDKDFISKYNYKKGKLYNEQGEEIDLKRMKKEYYKAENYLTDTNADKLTHNLSGPGGIYEQTANLLNYLGANIKTNKTYISRNTNKGIRTDIKEAILKLATNGTKTLKDFNNGNIDIADIDINRLNMVKNFWTDYNKFKSYLGLRTEELYNLIEKGTYIKTFGSLYTKYNGDIDKAIKNGQGLLNKYGTNFYNHLSDLEKQAANKQNTKKLTKTIKSNKIKQIKTIPKI